LATLYFKVTYLQCTYYGVTVMVWSRVSCIKYAFTVITIVSM